eukprot:scaffold229837_cov17-Tisochrysis_lutea.AAC.2
MPRSEGMRALAPAHPRTCCAASTRPGPLVHTDPGRHGPCLGEGPTGSLAGCSEPYATPPTPMKPAKAQADTGSISMQNSSHTHDACKSAGRHSLKQYANMQRRAHAGLGRGGLHEVVEQGHGKLIFLLKRDALYYATR